MTTRTQAEIKKDRLREHFAQAHASSGLEGHIPDPVYLSDCEAVIEGTMTLDELQDCSLARALAADALARRNKG